MIIQSLCSSTDSSDNHCLHVSYLNIYSILHMYFIKDILCMISKLRYFYKRDGKLDYMKGY